jgi:hypothetical protein
MANINLSQAAADPERKARYFDTGFFVALALLLLVGAVFGGLRWYLTSIDKASRDLDSQMAEKKVLLSGEKIDRLADFDSRLAYLKENQMIKEYQGILGSLERAMLPSVRATSFLHNTEDQQVIVTAMTDSFRTMAQQVQSFAAVDAFGGTRVSDIKRDDSGQLVFTLTADVSEDKQ